MFDTERAILRWRRGLERHTGLTAREVDELEDHLRARLELEQELHEGMATARVFRTVSDDIGEAEVLSREFAKAGRPRWRGLVAAGWALFAASVFLPVLSEFTIRYGYHVFWERWIICLPLLLTLWDARRGDPSRSRALVWLNTAAAFYLLVAGMDELIRGSNAIVVGDMIRQGSFFIGYWTWMASQLLVTAGLWIGSRRRVSARVLRAPV